MKTEQFTGFKPEDRFLSLNVFKFPLGNCGGITDTLEKESIWIPCEDGYRTYADLEKDGKLHLIFVVEPRGAEYYSLRPMIQPVGLVGPMAGGNLAYSSDSRCKRVYHIHDRFETQEANDMLSR